MNRDLYYYEYVRRPAAEVVEKLSDEAGAIFQPATESAVGETEVLLTELHVDIAVLDVGKEVRIEIGQPEVDGTRARIPVRWRAASQEGVFPSMVAELEVEPLSQTYPMSQLSLIGRYRPPLSVFGAVADATLGHRVAEAAVRNFVHDLARRLERDVPERQGAGP